MTTDSRIAVIGLGYVGLPLAVAFAEAGSQVQGVDVSDLRAALDSSLTVAPSLDAGVPATDAIFIVTAHRAVDWSRVHAGADLAVNTVNSLSGLAKPHQVLPLGAGWSRA